MSSRGAEEVVAAALVHQRVGVEALGHLGAARLAHQLHVVDEGRAVGPLVGARQRRHALRRLEGEGVARLAVVERCVQVLELRRQEVPVVQHLLQPGGDAGGIVRRVEVARDDDQLAVARSVLVGGEFHAACGDSGCRKEAIVDAVGRQRPRCRSPRRSPRLAALTLARARAAAARRGPVAALRPAPAPAGAAVQLRTHRRAGAGRAVSRRRAARWPRRHRRRPARRRRVPVAGRRAGPRGDDRGRGRRRPPSRRRQTPPPLDKRCRRADAGRPRRCRGCGQPAAGRARAGRRVGRPGGRRRGCAAAAVRHAAAAGRHAALRAAARPPRPAAATCAGGPTAGRYAAAPGRLGGRAARARRRSARARSMPPAWRRCASPTSARAAPREAANFQREAGQHHASPGRRPSCPGSRARRTG